MQFSKLDAYFHLSAHGDKKTFVLLYKSFASRCEKFVRHIVRQIVNLPGIPVDFAEMIDDLFFKIINEYDFSRGSFSYYVEYVLNIRFSVKLQRVVISVQNSLAFEFFDEKELPLVESTADPNQMPIVSDIAIDNFRAYIASPKRFKRKEDKIKNDVILLLYAGLSNLEICKKLDLTRGEFRGYMKRINEDQSIENLKLDLK